MPASFAHCLMAQTAIDKLQDKLSADQNKAHILKYASGLGEKNNFVVAGAAAPDYPFLTDIVTTSVLPIAHTWANRMHFEGTFDFINEGIKYLAATDKSSDDFFIKLAWFCGFVSHVMADVFVHPVVNSIVGGTYVFTQQEHGQCELVQDIYIFKKETGEDIVNANPRGGSFGYLKRLEECADPGDKDRIHPAITAFWKELLKSAHPAAHEYFEDITPDIWHHNYKSRVNFIVDPGAIFRHVVGLASRAYYKADNIPAEARVKYINKIKLPNGTISTYDKIFKKAIALIVDTWIKIFEDVDRGTVENVVAYIKDWNLDTGVDESQIYLWPREA